MRNKPLLQQYPQIPMAEQALMFGMQNIIKGNLKLI
jgi:hypothetical protein